MADVAPRRGRCVAQGRGGDTWPSRLLLPSLLTLHLGLLCHLEASVWESLGVQQAAGAFLGHCHYAARGAALSRTQVWASGEQVAGIWAGL